jgi:hypothetical protein
MPRHFEQTTPPLRVKESEREKLARPRLQMGQEVLRPALFAGCCGMAIGGGVALLTGNGPLAHWGWFLCGGGGAGLIALVVFFLVYHQAQNAVLAEVWREEESPAPEAPDQPPGIIPVYRQGQPVGTVARREPITVVDGGFSWYFTVEDIRRLERWLEVESSIRRDPSTAGPMHMCGPNDNPGLAGVTSGNYDKIVLALERAWLATGSTNSKCWTERGKMWVRGEIGPVQGE